MLLQEQETISSSVFEAYYRAT